MHRSISIHYAPRWVQSCLFSSEVAYIDYETLLNMLKARVSIRRFKPDPVPQEVYQRVLQAAVQAPSNHNSQPWHFVVVETPAVKRRLAEGMGQAWYQDLIKAGTAAATAQRLVNASVERFSHAPLLILGCLDESRLPEVPGFLRDEERLMGVQSVAMALYSAQLAATQLGLASCWYCAPLYCQDRVIQILQLPSHLLPQGLLVLGYPVGSGRPRGRRPWSEVTTVI